MSTKQRINQQPAWMLHSLFWRETSLIVEVFSRDHGRLALVAKGARRPHSALRGVLMAFQPLRLDWSGGGELKTLVRAEWQGGQPLLTGRALLCGYYLNELLMRFLAREDAHPLLFDAYAFAMKALAEVTQTREEGGYSRSLRRFELALLRELGYGVGLDTEADGKEQIQPQSRYVYIIEQGPVPYDNNRPEMGVLVSGQTLLDMAAEDFSCAETLLQAKKLLRVLIDHHLEGQPLQSRRILRELKAL